MSQLKSDVFVVAAKQIGEFHAQYRKGKHYNWKEPGPPRWKMWETINILAGLKRKPEDKRIQHAINCISSRLTDVLIEKTRNRHPRHVITIEALDVLESLYEKAIKPLETH